MDVSQIHILPSRTVLAVPASLIRVKEIFLNIQELRSEKILKALSSPTEKTLFISTLNVFQCLVTLSIQIH